MAFGSTVASAIGGGSGNFVGGSIVRLLLDSAEFQRGLSSSEARMHAFGRRVSTVGRGMQRFGATMTRNVTIPIVAAAGASVKMAVDFESAFTRIRANSNLTNKEIDELRKVVLDLAGKTAKSPRELAEGLYFLASAGLDATQVQETLTMAAKASASGFGEVGDIAKLTANALNAYAKQGLRAKEVTDTLAAGVREGTAEPEEFADALGRILPFASKAKVGFDEVVASLASLSNIGLDVNEGVTAMRGLLAGLLAPTKAASAALSDIGLSADQVRDSLSRDGLLATMRLLEDATDGNIDKLKAIIPNIRALVGQFGVTSQQADKVNASFRSVIGATGDLDKAFRTTKKDPGFQMKQLLAEIQVLAIEVGQDALPVLKDVAQAIRDGIKWFRELPKPMQDAIVKWGLLAAAMGPIIGILGRIVSLGGKAIGVLGGLGGAGAIAGRGAATAGAGAAVAGAGLAPPLAVAAAVGFGGKLLAEEINDIFDRSTEDRIEAVRRRMEDGSVSLAEFNREAKVAAERFGFVAEEIGPLIERFGEISFTSGRAEKDFADLMRNGADLTAKQTKRLGLAVAKLGEFGAILTPAERAAIKAALATDDFARAMDVLNGAIDTAKGRIRDAESVTDGFQGAVGEAERKVVNLTRAMHHVPNSLNIRFVSNIDQFRASVAGLRAQLDTFGSSSVPVQQGPLAGPGGRPPSKTKSSKQQIRASGGTTVNIDARGANITPRQFKELVMAGIDEANNRDARLSPVTGSPT